MDMKKLYCNGEVDVQEYTGGIASSIQLIESRLLTEGQLVCLGSVFSCGTLQARERRMPGSRNIYFTSTPKEKGKHVLS